MMHKKWHVLDKNTELATRLTDEAGISRLIADILVNRGICDKESTAAFLYPETEQIFYDPFLMKDMDVAVERIRKAIDDKEKIVIYGDYDVDGITAVSILYRYLNNLGADVDYYIPDRQGEGYGLNRKALDLLCEKQFSLLISVDCGISSIDEIGEYKDKISIIVTDHHIPSEKLPEAVAVVNPHRADCAYPDKNLAGVGVSFKLCQALAKAIDGKEYLEDMEIAALGTIADIVPLIGENRRIAKEGLRKMATTKNVGLRSLVSISAFDCHNIKSENVAFGIAPRLNAAGRLASAKVGVELLLTNDVKQANLLADELNAANRERQQIEQDIFRDVEAQLAEQDVDNQHIIIVCGENWHQGVIGIVASRLVDKYYLPAIVISISNGTCKGSCRSIKGFSIYDALKSVSQYLTAFGGHPMAAGLTLTEANLPEFRKEIEQYAAGIIKKGIFIPEIDIDSVLSPKNVDFNLLDELALLEPHGMGNPKPLFVCRNVQGYFAKAVGKEKKHLTFLFSRERNGNRAIAWNMAEYIDAVENGPIDVVFSPEINEWQGKKNIQCKLCDIQLYDDGQKLTRDNLVQLYILLKNHLGEKGIISLSPEKLSIKGNIPEAKLLTGLKILEEIGVISCTDDKKLYFKAPPAGTKLDLYSSRTFCEQ